MKIVFAGGGSGGHVYPLLAVAGKIREIAKKNQIIEPEMYYVSDSPYDPRALFELGIKFRQVQAGKIRRYFSIMNFFDLFRTAFGIIGALWVMYDIFPDVVFSKGGYASFPVLFAAKIFKIPVVIHESDSKPGRVSAWAAKFATKIAISYPDSAEYFSKITNDEKVAWTGQPIRDEIALKATEGAKQFLDLEDGVKTILVLGGSQGAMRINDVIIDSLPDLINDYQIIHQTGKKHFKEVKGTAEVVIGTSVFRNRYKPFEYLDLLAMRMGAGAADIVVSRAGSQIFEIAAWGIPSIIIPIPEEISHDQTKNAFNYARSGAGVVIEENNLSKEVLVSEIRRILNNQSIVESMSKKAMEFAKPNAALTIAEAVLDIALSHEK